MKIALIADKITTFSLDKEANIYPVTPLNYKFVLRFFKPDILFVESAWQGYRNRWKYKIAAYPEYPNRNNNALERVVTYAGKLGIPTVFWNKEDGVHFERFIESAKLFDHIFTVDANAVERYRKVVSKDVTVNTLMFAIQPAYHYFDGFNFKHRRASFVGSYSEHIHPKRREWQHLFFKSAYENDFPLVVYDRNSDRKAVHYRYPKYDNMKILKQVSYAETAQIYKENILSLNVNTIEDSPTMFSRRLIEILACGGIAVTSPSKAVDTYFSSYCHVVHTQEEMEALFERFREYGPKEEDYEMAREGAAYVHCTHTWKHRLNEIRQVIGI